VYICICVCVCVCAHALAYLHVRAFTHGAGVEFVRRVSKKEKNVYEIAILPTVPNLNF
jgi:hypothetical protein